MATNNFIQKHPCPKVEVVDFDTKTLEINVVTKNPVNERTREKIVQAIIEKGFKPEEFIFETKNGG